MKSSGKGAARGVHGGNVRSLQQHGRGRFWVEAVRPEIENSLVMQGSWRIRDLPIPVRKCAVRR